MKIAVSSDEKSVDSNVSEVFGKCRYFILISAEKDKIEVLEIIENTGAGQSGSSGISAAKLVAETSPDAVITGNIGPNAQSVLKQFEIPVYFSKGKITDAVKKVIPVKK